MINQKDWTTIVYRQWRGENIDTIAVDFEMKPKELREMIDELADDVKHLESEFEAQHTTRKLQNGFVLLAYNICRSREQLPSGVLEISEKSRDGIAPIETLEEAEQAIANFETDFGITLI